MPYTLGTVHSGLSGSGSFAIATPVGLKIAVSSIPAWVGNDGRTPRRYFRLGSLLPGNTDGYASRILLEHAAQLALPITPDSTTLAYELAAGASMAITELLAVPPLNSALQPWDRNPAAVNLLAFANPGGGGAVVTAWTYTVPAGKRLWLASARVSIMRHLAPTTINYIAAWVTLNGAYLVWAQAQQPTVGVQVVGEMPSGPMILSAGAVLAGVYSNADAGGTAYVTVQADGTLFDV